MPLLILAGNYIQAKHAAQSLGLDERSWRYIHGTAALAGIRNPSGILVGTFWERSDSHDIKKHFLAVGGKLSEEPEK